LTKTEVPVGDQEVAVPQLILPIDVVGRIAGEETTHVRRNIPATAKEQKQSMRNRNVGLQSGWEFSLDFPQRGGALSCGFRLVPTEALAPEFHLDHD